MIQIINGDCLEELRKLPAESVHCVVTSPPYWGLRDYGNKGGIGLEGTLQEHTEQIVAVFAEVWRVLRKDGTVWLNYGDCYASGSGDGFRPGSGRADGVVDQRSQRNRNGTPSGHGLKPKDLCMLPARIALALQDAGWWVRSEIVWAKPNPMPESVTDRPTSAHEKIYLLTKAQRYFYDAEAVREPHLRTSWTAAEDAAGLKSAQVRETARFSKKLYHPSGRNLRNVWTIATAPYSQAHFATFPPALVTPCIKAGTSEKGVCGECGAPWVRVLKKTESSWLRRRADGHVSGGATESLSQQKQGSLSNDADRAAGGFGVPSIAETIGWSPSCACGAEAVPATVLDPFGGAGTVGVVAAKLGRDAILIELNPEYCGMIERRLKAALLPTEGHSSDNEDHGPLFAGIMECTP